MLKIAFYVAAALTAISGEVARSEECNAPVSVAAALSEHLLRQHLHEGQVEYAGYWAKRELNGDLEINCSDRNLFENVLYDTRQAAPNSKMIRPSGSKATVMSRPVIEYPENLANAGLETECVIKFDVSAKGHILNRVSLCDDDHFEFYAAEAFDQIVVAPLHIGDEFIPETGLSFKISYVLE